MLVCTAVSCSLCGVLKHRFLVQTQLTTPSDFVTTSSLKLYLCVPSLSDKHRTLQTATVRLSSWKENYMSFGIALAGKSLFLDDSPFRMCKGPITEP